MLDYPSFHLCSKFVHRHARADFLLQRQPALGSVHDAQRFGMFNALRNSGKRTSICGQVSGFSRSIQVGVRRFNRLEHFQESMSDVKQEEYRSDSSYQLARKNTWEFPRFCFAMFRPSLESIHALLNAVKDYEGGVAWVMHDDCIGAWKAKPTGQGMVLLPYTMSKEEIEKHNESLRQPPDAAFIEKAVADIPAFCLYLEKGLGLTERDPQQFDPRWLTAEALAHSKGDFEDFVEPGEWSVFLARDPDTYAKTFKPTRR